MLDKLTAWGNTCGLKFNPEKSVAVLFTRRRRKPTKSLTIDGKPIPFQQEVKYLGVTLDSKLHWTPHINDKMKKAKRFISQVAAITRKNWGPKPQLMRWAYLAIVRPMLCYAAMIWGHRAQHLASKLSRINRMAMNTFGTFPRSTPTSALEVMLDIMPLHLHCLREGLAARIRLDPILELDWNGTNENKTHSTSHLRFWNTQMDLCKISADLTDACSQVKWSAGFTVNRDSFDGKPKHRTRTQYNIYTDGSRHSEQTGAGYVIYKGKGQVCEDSLRLPDHATVFQAEIAAVQAAAEALTRIQDHGARSVKIFIDSQAALRALENPLIKSKTVANAVEALNNLATIVTKVTLVWIPAHRGYFGNTKADDLAKKGAESTNPLKMLQIPKSTAAIKNEILTYVYRMWTNQWMSSPQARETKKFYLGPNRNKAKYVYKLARLELGRFVRVITGHNNLNYFQTRIGLWGNRLCRFCEDRDETFWHLITDCPRLRHTRQDILKDRLPSNDMSWSVRDILDFSYFPSVDAALVGTWAHGDPAGVDDLDSIVSDMTELGSHSN